MPRQSIAERLIKKSGGDSGYYIVAYDFPGHIPSRFYKNLEELSSRLRYVERVQRSVYMVKGRGAAEALRGLVEHYGGRVHVFKICET